MDIEENIIVGIPVIQNQQDFIISIFTIKQILLFTKYTKRLIVNYDENNEPIYNPEIQRNIENSRVQKIADFLIENPEATFPTNLVLHVPSVVIEKQESYENTVKIYLSTKVFEGVEAENRNPGNGDIFITIIDGQHRVRGIEIALERIKVDIKSLETTLRNSSTKSSQLTRRLDYLQGRYIDLLNIQLVVSFFIDKSLEYQAMIFATINRTQKKVSESLVYSLFGLTSGDSPHKTALQIVLILNAHPKSPFYNRVNLYGGSYSKLQSPPLSQATMVKSIIDLICENLRQSEKDRFKDRKELLNRSQSSTKRLPFRLYYANNQDSKISDILFYYFNAVKSTFIKSNGDSYWTFKPDSMVPNNILQTTVGYLTLLKLLLDILDIILGENRFNSASYIEMLEKAKHIDFNDTNRYSFNTRSANILYYDLSLAIWPAQNNEDARLKMLEKLLAIE